MLYQAEYFEKNPDSTFLMVADNAAYPYNEFLHILRYSLLVAMLVFATSIGIQQIRFYDRIKENAQTLLSGYDRQAANFMSANFDRLRGDLRYSSLYLHLLTTYHEMAGEQKLGSIMPTCENWCVIGDYFAAQGHYVEAERYYLTASRMIPTRMLPNYRLWKLYLEQRKTEQARQVGERILSQPLKVENTFTLRVKGEVGRWHTE